MKFNIKPFYSVIPKHPVSNKNSKHALIGLLALLINFPSVGFADDTDLGITAELQMSTPADINSSFNIELQPTNFGPGTSGPTTITFNIVSSPSTEAISTASGTGYTCTTIVPGLTTVTCTHPGLPVSTEAVTGELVIFTVDTAATTGTVSLSYSISHSDIDDVSSNDSGILDVTIEDIGALDFCYAVADVGNKLVRYRNDGVGTPIEIDSNGNDIFDAPNGNEANNIEAISFGPDPAGPELFVLDDNVLGTLDFNDTGDFTLIGEPTALLDIDDDQDGVADSVDTPEDLDSMAFHPQTLQLWVTEREVSDDGDATDVDTDYIFRMDFTDGTAVQDTFGTGVDAVRIDPSICSTPEEDVDDLAISPDGLQWFIQMDNNGTNQQVGLLELSNGIPTGNLDSCFPLIDVCGDAVEDMEGTGFEQGGTLIGTTGSNSNDARATQAEPIGGVSQCSGASNNRNDNRAWTIDTFTSTIDGVMGYVARRVEDLENISGTTQDFEGNDCRIVSNSGINRITGTIWSDENKDALFNSATENTHAAVTVQLFLDDDGTPGLSVGDTLLQTTISNAVTGFYEFILGGLSLNDYFVAIDTSTLPAETQLTTDNIEVASFTTLGNTENNNDFGYTSTDFGDAPDSYNTLEASGGPIHSNINSSLTIGSAPDNEADGAPSVNADGDDVAGATPDDEDGVVFFSPGGSPHVEVFAEVQVINDTGSNAFLCAWLDRWDINGDSVDDTFTTSDEPDGALSNCVTVTPSAMAGVAEAYTFSWNTLPEANGTTYSRFRLCNIESECNTPGGIATGGEVEDHILNFDFNATAITISDVSLESISIASFLATLGAENLSQRELFDLLQAWDPEAAADSINADKQVIVDKLETFLDPNRDGQLALFTWDTLEERGTVGFFAERSTDSEKWESINNTMLPGLISPIGGEYLLVDPVAESGIEYQYRLIEIESNGSRQTYGPFVLQIEAPDAQ